jgi:hypothetical protein
MTTRATLANALAYIAITDSVKYLRSETFCACMNYYTFKAAGEPGPFYTLTEEGRALADTARLWKAHAHLVGMGFKLDARARHKPGLIWYEHPEAVRATLAPSYGPGASQKKGRLGFATRRGSAYADIPSKETRSGWKCAKVATFKNGAP